MKKITKSLLSLLLLGFTTQVMALNPIQIENAIPSVPEDHAWTAFNIPANPHNIEGYADKVSVSIGAKINFFANVNIARDRTYSITIYRLGWYNGVGARRMTAPVNRVSIKQPIPAPNPKTGLVEANWFLPYSFAVPRSWVSGVYVATLIGNTTGEGQYVPFVVKNDASRAPYLFQTSDTTWQAYNNWGGKSLYAYNSTDGIPAVKVSYNRPYNDGAGTGSFSNYEFQMMRFLEREGYDVTYQSNIDTHLGGMVQLAKHKAFLSVGHDEYWTSAIRNNLENTKLKGLSLGFFGANAGYWQARLERSVLTRTANRTLVSYKYNAHAQDPYALDEISAHKAQVTTQWRDPQFFNRPENALIGIMYLYNPVDGDMVISNANHWIYTGTGLKNGDKLPGLLGYEVDAYFSNGSAPANVEILAHSPFNDGTDEVAYANMSIYTEACSLLNCISPVATVFATGSMQWIWGLDSSWRDINLENIAAQRMTRNVLARMIGDPVPN
ncbi:MAG: hypothetical protein HOP02_01120 [Methylococcaceae bacterium]|nr:hypothetical protein [Methylococcaceae bacterium]